MAVNKSFNKLVRAKKKSVLIICSHSDDQIIGAGGTMSYYAAQGYDVHTIIMSFGEGVKPHVRPEVVAKARVKEAQRADKIIGGKGVVFLGLREKHFKEDFERRALEKNFICMIKSFNPEKIFTHAYDDAHPDHRAAFSIVLKAYNKMRIKPSLYVFEVWHLLNLNKRERPKLVIDTGKHFKNKINALKAFKSQIDLSVFYNYVVLNNFLFFLVHIKDLISGIKHGYKYAEVFYKVR